MASEKKRPALRAESALALMKRKLPPPRWMIDDPKNDEELVEAAKESIKELKAAKKPN